MHHQALHVGHVGQQAENLEAIDELEGFGLAALHVEGENRARTVGEIPLVEGVLRMVRKARVVHLGHLRVFREELQDLLGVFHMAVQTQRQSLRALQQQEGVERRNGSAFVTKEDGADIDDESGSPCGGGKGHAVARVYFGELRELAASRPVELSTVHDDTAKSRSMTADKLGGGMNHDVGAVFQRTNQVGRSEGVVDDHRNLVLVGDFRNGLDVRDVGIGIAESLDQDKLGVVLDGALDFVQVVDIHEGGIHAEGAKGVLQQVVGTAIDGALGHHMVAFAGEGRNGVGKGCRTGCDGKACDASFQGGDALFKNILGGVGKAAVDVARVLQVETVGGVLGAVEHVRGGLVDRNGAGIGGRVCLFLAHMELEGFKVKLVLCRHGEVLLRFEVRGSRFEVFDYGCKCRTIFLQNQ